MSYRTLPKYGYTLPAQEMTPVKVSTTLLGAQQRGPNLVPGGLDMLTPSLNLQNGALRDGVNFEVPVTGGYARIGGYERYDGRPKPSDAIYVIVQVAAFVNVPPVGTTITQAVTGATGAVASVDLNPAYPNMVVTKVTGSFNTVSQITMPGPLVVGTATETTAPISTRQNAEYEAIVADLYRADIGPVPGSGPILGVVGGTFNNITYVYAFRNNVLATSAVLWQSSPAGWVQIPYHNTIAFTAGGGGPPLEGGTLTQGGVTATVKRVMSQNLPAWAGTATGTLVITNPVGGNFAAGAATITGGHTLTLSGPQTAITMEPNGRFQFDRGNFSGQDASARIYGCDGVNKGFEFDGEVLSPITTGLPIDVPTNVQVHRNHLFWSYQASLIYSGPGTPYLYLPVDGGGEIATGGTVLGMRTLTGVESAAALGIFQRNSTNILYGTDDADWNLVVLNNSSGGHRYSVQNLFDTFCFDDMGVLSMQATLNYGNFATASLTANILPFVEQHRAMLTASSINRLKSQYRIFFRDGFGLFMTISNQRYMGCCPVFFPNPVNCADSFTTAGGDEVSFFGSADTKGYVYELDRGSSFDGVALDAFITLPWEYLKAPRVGTRWRRASIEIQGNSWVNVAFGYQLGYGTPLIKQPVTRTYDSNFSAAPLWDVFTWDEFIWDGQTLIPTTVDMVGTAENVQVTISSGTNYIKPYIVNSVVYHYTHRRQLR